MAHREFVDSQGIQWEVWTVFPEYAERRRGAKPGRTPAVDRRERSEFRVPIASEWADGWLCFKSSTEKRRLAPVPNEWVKLPEAELEQLCQSAKPTRAPRRLIE
jgi:hypothetical protein